VGRGFRDEEPDLELHGKTTGKASAKAIEFQADEWDQPEWLPKSQVTVVPDVEPEEHGACTVFIKQWLARKNGWA
jgi:hypothetical protein